MVCRLTCPPGPFRASYYKSKDSRSSADDSDDDDDADPGVKEGDIVLGVEEAPWRKPKLRCVEEAKIQGQDLRTS